MVAIRQKHDTATKTAVVEQVLAKKLTVEQACKKHDLQPGQLYAWIGQYTLSKAAKEAKVTPAPQPNTADTTQKLRALASDTPPDLNIPFSGDPELDAEIERAVGRIHLQRLRDRKKRDEQG